MIKHFTEGESFEGVDFSKDVLTQGEYDSCSFKKCRLAEVDLRLITFSDCTFEECDLSMAKIRNAAFKTVSFKGCKMLGLRFDECVTMLLSFSFENCQLDFSSFFKLKMKSTIFKNCNLREVEFREADLTNARFENCDLTRALFENTILQGADFRTASNFSIDPESNKIKKARFLGSGLPGLLDKYDIVIE
ncbi:MAG: pentapeptide repeat-containing protein [Cyclobacteriaceae bacterium]|nr:pentapeptide repeat-containing protein [Cyclobacteriaceae bacterium]